MKVKPAQPSVGHQSSVASVQPDIETASVSSGAAPTPFSVAFEANPFVRAGKVIGDPMSAGVEWLRSQPKSDERTSRLTKQIQKDIDEIRGILGPDSAASSAKEKLEMVLWRLTGLGPVPSDQVPATIGQKAATHTALTLVAANLAAHSQSILSPEGALAGVAAAAAGYLVSEVMSYPFHFVVDNLEEQENMPAFLKDMVRTFQWHHIEPTRESRSAFARSAAPAAMGMLVPLAATLATHWSMPVDIALVAIATGAIYGTENHKMAHRPPGEVPTLYKAAKLAGLSIDDKEHGQHHTFPFSEKFGIVNGTSNSVLDGPLARKFEALMYRLSGETPHTWRYDPELMQKALELEAPAPALARASAAMKELINDTRGPIGEAEIERLRPVLPTMKQKDGQWVIEDVSPDDVDIPLLDDQQRMTRLARRILGATVPHPQMFGEVDWNQL